MLQRVSQAIHVSFRLLVLKPLDFIFYGGRGVLWRSREEWQAIIADAVKNMPEAQLRRLQAQYAAQSTFEEAESPLDPHDFPFARPALGQLTCIGHVVDQYDDAEEYRDDFR